MPLPPPKSSLQKMREEQTQKKRVQRSGEKSLQLQEKKQAQAVYQSEEKVARSTGYGPRYSSIAEAQKYVDSVVGSNTWKSVAPSITKVQLISTKDKSVKETLSTFFSETDLANIYAVTMAGTERSTWNIVFNLSRKTSMTQLVILHELAHVAVAPHDHGKGFQRTYIRLVQEFLGGNKDAKEKIVNSLIAEFESRGLSTFYKPGKVADGNKEIHIDKYNRKKNII